MEELQILEAWNNSLSKTEDGDEKKGQINIILDLVHGIQQGLQTKIKDEESDIEALESRLRKIQSGEDSGVPTERNQGNNTIKEKFHHVFVLQRSNILKYSKDGEGQKMQDKSWNGDSTGMMKVSKEEADYLKGIAKAAMALCSKEASKQRKRLAKEVLEDEVSTEGHYGRVLEFQRELDVDDMVSSLLKKLKESSLHEIKAPIGINKTEVDKYKKHLLELCWLLSIDDTNLIIVWSVDDVKSVRNQSCDTKDVRTQPRNAGPYAKERSVSKITSDDGAHIFKYFDKCDETVVWKPALIEWFIRDDYMYCVLVQGAVNYPGENNDNKQGKTK